MVTGTELASDERTESKRRRASGASRGQAVGCRRHSRDSSCGGVAQVFAWREWQFRRCSASCTSASRGEQAAGAGP